MSSSQPVVEQTTAMALEEKGHLQKSLRRFDMLFFTICALIGLDTLGQVSGFGAQTFAWVIILAVAFVLPYALLMAELGTTFTQEGGPYEWMKMCWGRFAAGVGSVLYWVTNPLWVGGSLAFIATVKASQIDGTEDKEIVLKHVRAVLDYHAANSAAQPDSPLRAAAERVCWFDWSDNDMDAVAAIEALRKGAASYVPKRNLAHDLIDTLERVLSVARSGRDGLQKAEEENFDVVVPDIKMPGEIDGLGVLSGVKKIDSSIPVVIRTAFASQRSAIEALNRGAYQYLEKSAKNDEIRLVIKNALAMRRVQSENVLLKRQLKRTDDAKEIIGHSEQIQRVLKLVEKVADLKGTMEYNHGSNRALNFGTMPKHLADVKADVIFLCVGMNDSFQGDAGVPPAQAPLLQVSPVVQTVPSSHAPPSDTGPTEMHGGGGRRNEDACHATASDAISLQLVWAADDVPGHCCCCCCCCCCCGGGALAR
jgi:DNA-binding NarL/FixJ family response regulator